MTDALIAVLRKSEDAQNLANPVVSTADSLMAMKDPTRDWSHKEVREALKEQVQRIVEGDDMSSLEATLACQAQLTHMITVQALAKFAASGQDDKARTMVDLALRAQNCCRMTIASICDLKVAKMAMKKADLISDVMYDEAKRQEILSKARQVGLMPPRKTDGSSTQDWGAIMRGNL